MKVDVTRIDRVCRLFCSVVSGIVTERALRETVGNDLSRAQFCGLQYVYLHPQCCIKDLANGLAVSHPAAVKLVERLEGKKLITRSPDEHDRRVVQLTATRTGARRAKSVIEARSEAMEAILAKSGGVCAEGLLDCLESFVRAALADEHDVNGVCLHCGGSHDDDCPVCQAEYDLTGELRTDA